MQTALTFVLWILFGWITAYFAIKRGRDPVIWFIVGMFMGVLGLLFLFVLPKSLPEEETPKPETQTIDDAIPIKVEPITPGYERSSAEWYYIDEERLQIGPVNFKALKKAWDSGLIKESSFVWSDGMEDWKQISEIEDLRNLLK